MSKKRASDPTPPPLLLIYNDLIISVFFIVAVSITAQLLRLTIRRLFAPKSWIRTLVLEIVATAEMCVTCFELGNVADNYGVEYYALFYFLSSLWWALTWKEAYASPNSHLEDYFNNETEGSTAVIVSATEVITACYVFRLLVRPLWGFKSIPIHREKLSGVCSADLSVRPIYGSAIEGAGTLVFSVISKITVRSIKSELLSTALNSLLDTILVVLAYNYSGGYFNPVLATSMQYGCKGATAMDHFIVYWLGGILGTLLAIYSSRYSESSKQD